MSKRVPIIAISAINSLDQVKTRIKNISKSFKEELIFAMLKDVKIATSSEIDLFLVISPDPLVLEKCAEFNIIGILQDEIDFQHDSENQQNIEIGLNEAFRQAIVYVNKLYPDYNKLIIQPDIPAIDPDEFKIFIDTAKIHEICVLQDISCKGTSMLFFKSQLIPPLLFGRQSAKNYLKYPVTIISEGFKTLRFDIDDDEDLRNCSAVETLGKYTTALVCKLK